MTLREQETKSVATTVSNSLDRGGARAGYCWAAILENTVLQRQLTPQLERPDMRHSAAPVCLTNLPEPPATIAGGGRSRCRKATIKLA